MQCVFEGNMAGDIGGTFRLNGPHEFYSGQNMFFGNMAPTGAVLAANSIHAIITIIGCHISRSVASAATIYAGELASVYIRETEFVNNTSEGSTVYVTNSVYSFICVNCIFSHNVAEVEGVISISYAKQIVLNSLEVENNNVTIGSMIMIKDSINTTVVSSFFKNNHCSGMPCALSIQKSDIVKIKYLFMANYKSITNIISRENDKLGALDINAINIALEFVHFQGVPGYVYRGVSVERLFFKNASYECPESHIHNINLINTNIKSLQNFPHELENDTSLVLQCMQCSENYYRFAIPSVTLMEISDLYHPIADGECYKCPSGGICDGNSIVAHPNYWGFVYKGKLKFVFCSEGFCCQVGSCITYNGCNEGREGDLCTSCKNSFRLSIVSNDCIQKEQCAEGWLYGIMVISGLVYVGFLLAKVEVMNILQQIYFAALKCKWQMRARKNNKKTSKYVGNVRPEESTNLNEWVIPFDHVEIFHVLVFHLQDASLFQVRFPGMQSSTVQLEEFKEKLLSIVRLNSLTFWNQFTCFPSGWTQLNKILFESSIILVMICILLLSIMVIKVFRIQPNVKNRLMSSACRVFLLTFLFSSQRLCSYALNFISCEDLGPARHLFIDTTIECYQLWQIFVFCYICLFIIPFWLVLFLGPGLLEYGMVTVRIFLLGLMFPGPFVIYYIWLIYKGVRTPLIQSCHQQTSTAVINEVWSSFNPFPSSRFLCWGGVVELRRLALVFCATLISLHLDRLICMIVVVLLSFAVHVRYHPYSDHIANTCANISLCAMIMVGVVNIYSAAVDSSGGSFSYGDAEEIGKILVTFENILVDVFPASVVVFCIGYFLYVNITV